MGPKQQKINHISQNNSASTQEEFEYQTTAESKAGDISEETNQYDEVYFLRTSTLLPFVERTIAGRITKLLITQELPKIILNR